MLTREIGGPLTLENDFVRLAEEGLQQGETVGLGVALVVLVVVFGAVIAGLIFAYESGVVEAGELDIGH